MGRVALLLFFLLVRSGMLASVLAGRTEGVFTVSPSGAATYQIPIKVQPGLSSSVPAISLCYNSQGGNGIAGYGWSLSGFSAISITPRCMYFDGQAEAICRGEDNAFMLDGMRLLHKSGTNGQAGATYCTEYDLGNLIEIASCANGTPETFTVKTTDGRTCKYGSASGRKMADNGEAYEWALDYAEDALGNYISYEYGQEGILYPVSITYGKNTHGDNGVLCHITFDYEERSDSILSYQFGMLRPFTKRLARVTCKYADYTYRAYSLGYSEGTFSRLVSVTESGTGSSSYRPTTFTWNTLPSIQFSSEPKAMEAGLSSNTDDEYYFSGDVDGDGLSDLLISKGNSAEWHIARNKGCENGGYFAMQAVGCLRADFLYDADGNRLLMKVYRKQGGTHIPYFTRYYLGDNTEVTKEGDDFCNYLYYAGDDCYTAPAVLHLNEEGYGSICQITRDNLGSALQYED